MEDMRFNDVITILGNVVRFRFEHVEVKAVSPDPGDILVAKTALRLEAKKMRKYQDPKHPLDYDRLNYLDGGEIGSKSGMQLLHYLASVMRNDEAIRDGGCVLFAVEGVYQLALLIFHPWDIQPSSVGADEPGAKYVYLKLFDDEMVAEYRRNKNAHKRFFAADRIAAWRANLPARFAAFMREPIARTERAYMNAFFGVIVEIVKSQVVKERTPKRERSASVPVAACVKLAVDSGRSGELQQVFNCATSDPWKELKAENARRVQMGEAVVNSVTDMKTERRMKAAETILKRAIGGNEDESYNANEVKKLADDLSKFFNQLL